MAQMAVELSPTDLARMNALLQALPDTYARQAQSAGMRAYARVVRKDAKATTAFRDRTGTLRGSIGVGRRSSRSRGRKIRGAGAVVFASAPHAHLIELGTSRMRAQPFLEPALEQTQRQALRAGAYAMRRKLHVVAHKLIARHGGGRR